MRVIYILSAIIISLGISLSIFELLLNIFHSPFGHKIIEPKAHALTWIYLLKQKYITFIDLDIFSIHEKRHLLDVKRIFERVYWIWRVTLLITVTLIIFAYLKRGLKEILKYIFYIGVGVNSLLVLLSTLFLDSFKLLHKLLFPNGTWIFPPNSILIEWFPLEYFVEFFIIYILLNLLFILIIKSKILFKGVK